MKTEPITAGRIAKLLPPRDPGMHKGGAGRVLVVAGSPGMAGAAVLSAGAALRCGAGLVYVSADESLWPVVQMREPCAICVGRPHGKTSKEAGARERLPAKTERLPGLDFDPGPAIEDYDALAVGPGLGTGPDAVSLVARILSSYAGPLVLDADALNIVAETSRISRAPGNCADDKGRTPGNRPDTVVRGTIITPHPGEAARLLGVSAADVQADRRGAARELAKRCGAVAVLKGRGTLVAVPFCGAIGAEPPSEPSIKSSTEPSPQPSIEIFENTTGNPGMATAGSGDVLTGAIASFAGQGMSVRDAAVAGVFVHGLAGDLAAHERGEYGMVATDIVDALPLAIMRVAGS